MKKLFVTEKFAASTLEITWYTKTLTRKEFFEIGYKVKIGNKEKTYSFQ